MSEDTTTFIGIADCHGLESFLPMEGNENNLGFMIMRASANRHRHALVYQLELNEFQEGMIKKALEAGAYIKACEMLHDPSFIDNVGVEQSMLPSWEMIPNPRLDPYSGRFHEDNEEEE
ncbi:unnamed protein product [marine sediment metagenome]|uniref:Uncharacterized protein n=1 Tax=marine sediment metagenome TaxID=412755 RepID=X1PI78_9ZZZZ